MGKKTIRAWHFLADKNGRPVMRDGSPAPAIGQKLTVDGDIIPCERGLHASARAIDALEYAPGPWACLVECGGKIVHEKDKLAASERTIVAIVNAERLLHEFACDCAANAIERDEEANGELWLAIDMKLAWLDGLCDDNDLAAAGAAARDAAGAAARDAVRAAAWAAAWDAARDAAGAAAWDAAWAAARDAARDAAGDAENEHLEQMLRAEMGV